MTGASPPPLPEFENPPVVEVALSIQFEPLEELRTPHLGLIWAQFRDRYPRFEEHPPIERAIERFEGGRPRSVGSRIVLMGAPPLPRLHFINEGGERLLQVQHDRFIQNWRKQRSDDPYPRYRILRDSFGGELGAFREMLDRESIGELKADQWEVTYVNHIASGEGWRDHGELQNVLRPLSGEFSDSFLSEIEESSVSMSFVIPDARGAPLGRLRATAEPAYSREDKSPMFVLRLIARGATTTSATAGLLESMDIGHEWIVRGFASMTTARMHEAWRRTNDRRS